MPKQSDGWPTSCHSPPPLPPANSAFLSLRFGALHNVVSMAEQLRNDIDIADMHFIPKPFSVQQINAKVSEVLGLRRS